MRELGLYDITPALCHLDYTMSEAGGVTNFVRQYTLASGGAYCDCGYKKKVPQGGPKTEITSAAGDKVSAQQLTSCESGDSYAII